MEFTCTKTELSDILNIVQKAVSVKSVLPIMECIKIDCTAGVNAVFTSNNNELSIRYDAALNVTEGGCIALASKIFCDIVRKLPDGIITVKVNEENNVTKIKSGISEFNITGVIAREFPDPPEINEKLSFKFSEGKLKNILKKVIPFMSVNEGKRPVLNGALFEIKNGKLTVVASDGHRLAVVNEQLEDKIESAKFIIPGSTLRELVKILKDDDSEIRIVLADRHVLIEFEHYNLYTRIIEGDFLKYEAIIAANNTIRIEADTNELRNALERAMLIINDDDATPDKRMPVRLTIGYDKIEISSMTPKGKINDAVSAKVEGGSLVIGFNCRFLLEALSACDEERVLIEFSTPNSGVFMRSLDKEKNNYVFMILPVRLYN